MHVKRETSFEIPSETVKQSWKVNTSLHNLYDESALYTNSEVTVVWKLEPHLNKFSSPKFLKTKGGGNELDTGPNICMGTSCQDKTAGRG
ncbi:hypothetical protein RRG08_045884 [Elysia crispata]|uniref:Uncharacterized protein n=1 Tax=Elysia crispata TaxID=231223 RepID=A0AAE0ZFN5_9GAST|nr:hypothetical protein RRG08_045884 [Elysia crispata]